MLQNLKAMCNTLRQTPTLPHQQQRVQRTTKHKQPIALSQKHSGRKALTYHSHKIILQTTVK